MYSPLCKPILLPPQAAVRSADPLSVATTDHLGAHARAQSVLRPTRVRGERGCGTRSSTPLWRDAVRGCGRPRRSQSKEQGFRTPPPRPAHGEPTGSGQNATKGIPGRGCHSPPPTHTIGDELLG
eukprot:gene8601-biopygen21161